MDGATSTIMLPPLFDSKNEELRTRYRNYKDVNHNVERDLTDKKINELVQIIHNENPTLSIRQICFMISAENDDLYGLSSRSIYNKLSEENRQLIDNRKYKRKKGDNKK